MTLSKMTKYNPFIILETTQTKLILVQFNTKNHRVSDTEILICCSPITRYMSICISCKFFFNNVYCSKCKCFFFFLKSDFRFLKGIKAELNSLIHTAIQPNTKACRECTLKKCPAGAQVWYAGVIMCQYHKKEAGVFHLGSCQLVHTD